MSIAQLDTLYTAAVAAIDAADWDTAIAKLMAVQARLATTPNLTRSLAGGGSQGLTWNPGQISELIANCRRQKAAARHASVGPFQTTKITYARAASSDDYS